MRTSSSLMSPGWRKPSPLALQVIVRRVYDHVAVLGMPTSRQSFFILKAGAMTSGSSTEPRQRISAT